MLDIWPENWPVWQLWQALENRWLMVGGLSGIQRQGLDMTQAESIMRLRGIKRKERARILDGLLVMEGAALAAIYE